MSMWIETKRKFATLPMYKKLTFDDIAPKGYDKISVCQNIGFLVKEGFLKRMKDKSFIKVKQLSIEYVNKESCRNVSLLKKMRKNSKETAKVHKVFDTIGLSHLKWLLSDVYD